ncbi:MAG: helix-turn-helix domain-containing protein [Fimbriimonadaceae bacterium]|nr:helix-turn-helix domain-containing protein [Fimbriimonadaceae bacterium]
MDEIDIVAMFKALGDPTRKAIVEFLCERCCPVAVEDTGAVHPIQGATVGEVCCHVTGSEGFSSTVSFHLKELRIAGLIDAEKDGKYMVCSIRREALDVLASYLASLPRPSVAACAPAAKETNR